VAKLNIMKIPLWSLTLGPRRHGVSYRLGEGPDIWDREVIV